MLPLQLIIGFSALIYATIYDLLYREVPDLISYGLITITLGISLIKAITANMWSQFFWTAGIGILFYFGAMLLFYSGQWGGGDSKLLIGSAMLFPSYIPFIFFAALIAAGALYGTIYASIIFFQNSKKCTRTFWRIAKTGQSKAILTTSAFMISVIIIHAVLTQSIISAILAFIIFLLPATYLITSTVEHAAMTEIMPVSQLTEGEWLATSVRKGKKVILEPPKYGIEQHEINLLKSKGIQSVKIKKGIPFVPAFLIAATIAYVFGPVILSYLYF